MSKLTLMGRLITVGGPSGLAMGAIVQRGFRAAGQFLVPGGAGTMGATLSASTWVSSLVSWLAEVDVGIHRPGLAARAGNPSMPEVIGNSDTTRREMASLRGVGHLAEIHMVGDSELPIPGMEWVVDENPAPRSRIELRVGQVWSFATGPNVLQEVVGFIDNDVVVVTWSPGKTSDKEDVICRGGKVHLGESNFCHGAGGANEHQSKLSSTPAVGLRNWFSCLKSGTIAEVSLGAR